MKMCRLLLVVLLAGTAPLVKADQLFVAGIATPQQVTFTDFANDRLIYRTPAGDQNDRELSRISHVAVDGETAFNDAEKVWAQEKKTDGDIDRMIDGYTKAIRGTSKPWLRSFAARRLLGALGDRDRFEARIVAYLALLQNDPEGAQNFRPQLPDKGSKLLDTAANDVENVLKQPGLPGAQQLALYSFLIELHRQRGDENAVLQVLERLDRLSTTLGDLPEVKQQLAVARVSQAKTALDQKKYAEAAKLINDNRSYIVDPRLQADALFILASVQRAQANDDKSALKDAALAYMRVVAHCGDVPGKPHVVESLRSTAQILEQLGTKKEAIALHEQIAREFADTPAAEQAKKDIERLSK